MSSIRFIEDGHSYYNDKDEKYISVSGVEKLLEPYVDWDEVLKKKVKSLKKYDNIIITEKELKAKWENARIKGTEAGTALHKTREQSLLNTTDLNINNVRCNLKPCSQSGGVKYSLVEEKLENNTVYPEAIIYDHSLKVCGQADIVEVVNNTITVKDYKTDKKIDRQAFRNERVSPEHLLPPVAHLEKCEFNVYSLKMSMYMYLLWKKNKHLKIGDLILIWEQLLRDDEGIPILDDEGQPSVTKTEIIKVPYLRKEVKDVFEWWKEGKLKQW